MKLLIQDDRVIATALDEYEGPARFIEAPEDFDIERMQDYRVAEDGTLTLLEPEPEPGTPSTPTRAITYWAFRKRFTHAERVGLELAALDDPTATPAARQAAAAVRVYLADAAAARWIDLGDEDTRLGAQALEAMGLLAVGRAVEILDAPVLPAEIVPAA